MWKSRLTYPRRASPPMGRELIVFRINRGRHHVATDTGQRQTAFRYFGRGIVRTARAIVSRTRRGIDLLGQHHIFRFQESQTCLDQITGMETRNP
jgi:hypothetical protein